MGLQLKLFANRLPQNSATITAQKALPIAVHYKECKQKPSEKFFTHLCSSILVMRCQQLDSCRAQDLTERFHRRFRQTSCRAAGDAPPRHSMRARPQNVSSQSSQDRCINRNNGEPTFFLDLKNCCLQEHSINRRRYAPTQVQATSTH